MTNNLQAEIARREKICAAATPGPWHTDYCESTALSNQSHPVLIESAAFHRMRADGTVGADAPFAAHARTGYPEVLAALADAVAALEEIGLHGANAEVRSIAEASDKYFGEFRAADNRRTAKAALAQIAGRLKS